MTPATSQPVHSDIGEINISPRIPALKATHLNWLLATYIASCRARLANKITVDGYEYELRWFVDWWNREGPPRNWLLTPPDLAAFEVYLRGCQSPHTGKTLAYHTRLTILKRLREALKWAQELGYVDRDYRQWIPQADGAPPKRKAPGLSSLKKLLDSVKRGPYYLRNRAIIAILMGMGLRREEASHLNIEDIVIMADCSGYARVTGKRTRANPEGKREAAFDKPTGAILVAHIDATRRISGPLFVSKHGKRLSGQGIYKMLKDVIEAADLEEEIIGPHDLRRAFATHYRRNRSDKMSGDLLRRQLGHASYSQTDEYTLLDVNDIRLDIVSPLFLLSDKP